MSIRKRCCSAVSFGWETSLALRAAVTETRGEERSQRREGWFSLAMMPALSKPSTPRPADPVALQYRAVIYASPMTYSVNGVQYVAICAGSDLFTFAMPH